MKTVKSIFLILLLFPFVGMGQDIHFSQMRFSPLTLNPALAGANNDFQASMIYRSQWNSVAEPYRTIAASVYSRLNPQKKNNARRKKAYISAGLDFFNDQAGSAKVRTNHINLSVAAQILMDKHSSIGLGIYGGWGQRSIDPTSSTWASQYDGKIYNPALPSGEVFRSSSFNAFDIGAGLIYRYHSKPTSIGKNDGINLNIGFATYHLNRPNYSFLNPENERMYMRFTAFAQAEFGLKDTRVLLDPAIYYFQQGPAKEIYLGMFVKYIIKQKSHYTIFVQPFTASLGLLYRNKDALIVKAMLNWNGLGIGFAYDVNLFNSLINVSNGKGAFEIALSYTIPDYARRPFVSGGHSFF